MMTDTQYLLCVGCGQTFQGKNALYCFLCGSEIMPINTSSNECLPLEPSQKKNTPTSCNPITHAQMYIQNHFQFCVVCGTKVAPPDILKYEH